MPYDEKDYSDDFQSDEEDTEIARITGRPPLNTAHAPTKHKKTSQLVPSVSRMRRGGSPSKGRTGSAPQKNVREMWLDTVKKRTGDMASGKNKGHLGKRSPMEYWTDTLRKSGAVKDNSSMTFRDRHVADRDMAYLSTSHYMRQMAGTEKPRPGGGDPTARAAKGTPAYKTPEEYYDEILELRKQIAAISSENSTQKARVRRLEEDNLKKEREIETLLDPSKSEEMRRTLGDRKPDTGAVIHSMKQKVLKLEQQLRDKESNLTKLQADLKTTKVEELRLQMEAFYQEVVRLQNTRAAPATQQSSQSSKPGKENPSKIKALNDTILRMNEKNVKLQTENRTLKEDLEKMLEEQSQLKEKQADYEDMNKKQLMNAITKLEKRLEKTEVETASVKSETSTNNKGTVNTKGKITLEGSLAERLDQLDQRETELLEELEKQRNIIKRLKEDRQHYRQQADDREKEIKTLRKEIEALQSEVGKPRSIAGSRPSSGRPKISPRLSRRDSVESTASSRARREKEKEELDRKVQDFQEQRAAKSIQKGWKGFKTRKALEEEEEARKREELIESFRKSRAAKTIQKEWRDHHRKVVIDEEKRKAQVEKFREQRAARRIQKGWLDYQQIKIEREDDEAAETIQSALRGHSNRRKQLRRYRDEEEDEENIEEEVDEDEEETEDEDVMLIQSTLRGHKTRKDQLRNSALKQEEAETDEAALLIQSAARGHLARKYNLQTSLRSRPGSTRTSPRSSRPSSAKASPHVSRRSSAQSRRLSKITLFM
ncbi:IQ domain-containing protein E-like [Lingula anatina]|uniref:IQ domain-containing protein E-like n=1 Tax=Lingula anatina TaxID=7574 RepID=A0A1S3I136_LINAN|nr:IQ domain-containing protein E-like [Lingula anatina]|eukprot:XP_013391541.1 IQ domain-containing protein E-like [Lingula anatina]